MYTQRQLLYEGDTVSFAVVLHNNIRIVQTFIHNIQDDKYNACKKKNIFFYPCCC